MVTGSRARQVNNQEARDFGISTDPFHAAKFVVALAKDRGLKGVIDEFLKVIAQHMPRPLAAQVPEQPKRLGRRWEAQMLAGLLSG